MKKTHIAGLVVVMAIAFGLLAIPKTMAERQVKEDRSVTIDGATPEHPVVSLGKAFDKKSGKKVEGYAIVHYAKGSGNSAKPTPTPTPTVCYGFLAEGAKWKGTLENWIVDSENTGGLSASYIVSNMADDIGKWEFASGTDILGTGNANVVSNPKTFGKIINNQNEVTFAPIRSRGAIAVTYIWGIFSGPIASRQLTEWDQVYNTNYAWSEDATGSTSLMDFENIATHELGHSVGMNDLYNTSCSTQTMYGYADYGEIDKRSLESEDVTGIQALYNY